MGRGAVSPLRLRFIRKSISDEGSFAKEARSHPSPSCLETVWFRHTRNWGHLPFMVTQDFVADLDLLSQGVERLTIGGETALYDAVRTGCQKLLHRPEQDVVARVLVVLSDGQNDAGEVSLDGAIDAAQEAEVTNYAISTNYPKPTILGKDLAANEGNSNLRARSCAAGTLFPISPQTRLTGAIEKSKSKREKREKSWKFMRERDIVRDSRPRSVPTPQRRFTRPSASAGAVRLRQHSLDRGPDARSC
jgi:hypothetical protein